MDLQADILRAIQSAANPFFDFLFTAVTSAAESLFIVGVLLIVYWCFDKESGIFLMWTNLFGQGFSTGIKGIFKVPRPFDVEGIRVLHSETATGYSFPSGHTNAFSNMMWSFALWYKKKNLFILAAVLPLVVAFSRMYLGCHWPVDVLGGYVLGLAAPFITYPLYKRYPKKRFLFCLISAAIYIPFLFVPEVDKKDIISCLGCSFGLAAGIYIENKFVNFENAGNGKNRLLRIAVGLPVIAVAYFIPKLIFPASYVFDFIRYFIIGVIGIAIAPAIFKKLKI